MGVLAPDGRPPPQTRRVVIARPVSLQVSSSAMSAAGSIRLLILDCDGVLVRSEDANLAYYNALFQTMGLPPVGRSDREALHRLHTLSTPQVIDAFFPPEMRPEASRCAAALEFSPFLAELEPEPGWEPVLRRWRERGRVAVATNRGASARAVLEAVGVAALVDAVVTIRDVERPKPHPDLLLKALERFGAEPEHALYVGDSELDREAAARAGVRFLGFRGAGPPVAGSPEQVERFLEALAPEGPSASLAMHTL